MLLHLMPLCMFHHDRTQAGGEFTCLIIRGRSIFVCLIIDSEGDARKSLPCENFYMYIYGIETEHFLHTNHILCTKYVQYQLITFPWQPNLLVLYVCMFYASHFVV